MRISGYGWGLFVLAVSVSLSTQALAQVNTVNNGAVINSGTYRNTADSKTTFTNTTGGGLWLKSGSNIRGVEVDSAGNLTNNGGTFHFFAPRDVVRLDGNIDVRGIRNNQGTYLGNGGKVFVDSAYLYQSGNIYANGLNGGLVQFNVGAATLAGNARIEAKGTVTPDPTVGKGGTIAINASGPVDLGRQTLLDTSGKVMGSFDTNIINIEGGLVNASGVLQANGVDSRGGTIRMVSTGQTDLSQTNEALSRAVTAGNFTGTESYNIKSRLNELKTAHDGDIVITAASYGGAPASIFANGHPGVPTFSFISQSENSGNDPSGLSERAGDGGTIIMTAANDIENGGWILANGGSGYSFPVDTSNPNSFIHGGHGGTISLNAGQDIINTGRIVSDGGIGGLSIDLAVGRSGGPAGLIAFNYEQMQNSGVIRAIGGEGGSVVGLEQGPGGNGGLVVFSGSDNPSGNGTVVTYPGRSTGTGVQGTLGSVVAPNPATSTNTLIGVWRKTKTNELLTHAENLLLLTRNGGSGPAPVNLFDRMLAAQIRSVEDQDGSSGAARNEVISKNTPTSSYVYRNLVVSSTRDNLALDMSHPFTPGLPAESPELILPSPLSNGQAFTTLNTLTVSNDGSVVTNTFSNPAVPDVAPSLDFWALGRAHDIQGGARISALANGDFTTTNRFATNGVLSGGSINIASTGTFSNGDGFTQGSVATTASLFDPFFAPQHGGAITLKAGGDILNGNNIFMQSSQIFANGALMGGTQRLQAGRDILNMGLFGNASIISANGGLQGGLIDAHAGRNLLNGVDPADPNPGTGNAIIRANGTLPTLGRGGFIRLIADEIFNNAGTIEANGAAANGTIITSP